MDDDVAVLLAVVGSVALLPLTVTVAVSVSVPVVAALTNSVKVNV